MPPRRALSHATSAAALEAARLMRDQAVRVCTEAPIGSPAYKAASNLMDAIDGLAEALTGRRETFWHKQHSAGG